MHTSVARVKSLEIGLDILDKLFCQRVLAVIHRALLLSDTQLVVGLITKWRIFALSGIS
jgi:hypothetical protein